LKDTKFFCDPCKTKLFTKDEKLGFEIIYNLHQGEGHEVVEYRKPEPLYRCVTCNDAGPFSESDVGSDGKSIVGLHRKLGHEVTEYQETEPIFSLRDGVIEDKRITIDPGSYNTWQEINEEIKRENANDSEYEPISKHTTEEIAQFAKLVFCDSCIATNDSSKVYAVVPINDHNETIDLDFLDAQDILISNYMKRFKKIISTHQAESAIRFIKAEKRMSEDTPKKQTYIRCAFINDVFYYDLANLNREIVVISKNEKKIVPYDSTCPIFIRTSSMSEQVRPNFDYQDNPLQKYFKLLRKSNDIVFQCNVLCLFLEHIDVSMPLFDGNTNVGKTLTSAIIKMLVDPSGTKIEDNVTSMPTKPDDFATLMYCSYLVIFENISTLSNEQSDNLCRAITGASLSSRMLYKQGIDKRISYKRKIILNGIGVPIERDDLARRVIPYDLLPFEKGEKRTNTEILQELNDLMPDVLGHVFDTWQKAMQLYDVVRSNVEVGFRGDFEIRAEAISQALGNEPNRFLDALKGKEIINNEKLSQSNCLLPYIDEIFNNNENLTEYCFGAAEFHKGIRFFADENGFDLKNKDSVPSSSGKLPDVVKRSSTLLSLNSYVITFRTSTKKEIHNNKQYNSNTKFIEIKKIKEVLFA